MKIAGSAADRARAQVLAIAWVLITWLPWGIAAAGEAPTIVGLDAGLARSHRGWDFYPLRVQFEDPDRDLRGGWLVIEHDSARYEIVLEYAVFNQISGTASIPFVSNWTSGSVWLIDRSGLASQSVDLALPVGTISNATYWLTPTARPYDDFEGHGAVQSYNGNPLAVPRGISRYLWAVSAQDRSSVMASEVPTTGPGGGSGWAMRFEHRRHWKDASHAHLISPGFDVWTNAYNPPGPRISFPTFDALAADIMISSESTSKEFAAALTLSVGFGTDDYDARLRGWHVGVRKDRGTAQLRAFARYENLHFPDESRTIDLAQIEPDEWNRFRLECEVISATEMRIHFVVNGSDLATMDPGESELLLSGDYRSWSGPSRSLMVTKPQPDGEAIAYFDNVVAVYEDRQQ